MALAQRKRLANAKVAKTASTLKRRAGVVKRKAKPASLVKRSLVDAKKQSSKAGAGIRAWEKRLWKQGFKVVVGTDEAGRGPWAGPVVAAAFAVLAHEDEEVRTLLATVADSKRMSVDQREDAFVQLTDARFKGRTAWAIAQASVEEIDRSDILRASLRAMSRAVRALSVRADCVLVDGCNRPPELLKPGECWTRGSKKIQNSKQTTKSTCREGTKPMPPGKGRKDLPQSVQAVVGGDAKVPSISAASVLAKVHRDRLMKRLDDRYPMYGFKLHKGYGTALHQKAIKRHGVSDQHRKSFAPVAKALRKRPKLVRSKSRR